MKLNEFRIEMIKEEIGIISTKINHFDDLRLRTRQTCITLWTAAIGAALIQKIPELFVIAAFLPIPFWLIEARYRHYQRGWHLRLRAIRDFIRDEKYNVLGDKNKTVTLDDFLKIETTVDFPTIDYWARRTVPIRDHKKETSLFNNIFSWNNVVVYVPLCLIALIWI